MDRFRRVSPRGRRILDIAVTLALIAATVWGVQRFGGFEGEDIRVIDGDSLIVNGREVRLHGIDAVELHQTCREPDGREWPCGRLARAHLRKLVHDRSLTCRTIDEDRYGRIVARCIAENGMDIGERMVRDGWAVAHVRHSPVYVMAERDAHDARRGIWAGRFMPPEEWRARRRTAQGNAFATGDGATAVPRD